MKRNPSILSRYGTTRGRWERGQVKRETAFWADPSKFEKLDGYSSYREKYFNLNRNMFTNLRLDFPEGRIVDVGCGPEAGFLPYCKARVKIGIEPLTEEYSKSYKFDEDVIMVSAMGENIPLPSESTDACYSANALDHCMRPYKVLEEMYRILKPGGYFALSTDIGGTKEHPIKLYAKDLDKFFAKKDFKVIEKKYSAGITSSWGQNSDIPLYIFQGIKI